MEQRTANREPHLSGRKYELAALWSQLPMLVLMVAFTTAGLWILSLPIAAGQVQDPLPASSSVMPAAIASMPVLLDGG